MVVLWFFFYRNMYETCVCVLWVYVFFLCYVYSCSMVIVKIIFLSIGFIKKKVKEDIGSRKNRIEKRNIEKKVV